MRRRQTKPNNVLVEGEPRQTEKKTERLNALTRRNHPHKKAIEERKGGRRGRRLQGNGRRRRRRLSASLALNRR